MAQVVLRENKIMMITSVDYPAEIVRDMKKAGYKVLDIAEADIGKWASGEVTVSRRKRSAR